jgi:hypothetical protein
MADADIPYTEHIGRYIKNGCPNRYERNSYSTLNRALRAARKNDCGGVTLRNSRYEVRGPNKSTEGGQSSIGEISYFINYPDSIPHTIHHDQYIKDACPDPRRRTRHDTLNEALVEAREQNCGGVTEVKKEGKSKFEVRGPNRNRLTNPSSHHETSYLITYPETSRERRRPPVERRHPSVEPRRPPVEPRRPPVERRHPSRERRHPSRERRHPSRERRHPSRERRHPSMYGCLANEPRRGSILHICQMPYRYLTWNDIGAKEPNRLINAQRNMYTNLNYLLKGDWRLMEKQLLSDGISLHIGNPNDFFKSHKAILKGNHSLNIRGNIILKGDAEWSPYPEYDRYLKNRLILDGTYRLGNKTLDVDPNTDILFNYTVAPNPSFYRDINKYYRHMKNAIKLGMDAMYEDLDNSGNSLIRVWQNGNAGAAAPKPKILIWNPFGLGAFIRKYRGNKEAVKEEVIRLMLEIYRDGHYDNSKLIYVGKNIISDDKFYRIFDQVYNVGAGAGASYDLKANHKSVILASGDMLTIARETRQLGHPTAVSMAADIAGPGNHFFNLPGPRKSHTARQASDENNTRRSNIIWKAIYINIKQLLNQRRDINRLLDINNVRRISGSSKKLDQLSRNIESAYMQRRHSMEYVSNSRSINIPTRRL